MPIAYLYVNKRVKIDETQSERLIDDWSKIANVNKEYCTINVVENFIQVGTLYKVMVNLYLPSLWEEDDIRKIQKSLFESIVNNLDIEPNDVFIMTSVIQSGHVLDKGTLEEW